MWRLFKLKVPPYNLTSLVVQSHCISIFSPVSQSQDKQLQEGRVYEQVLIFALELGEPRQPVSPAPCGLH